MELYKLDYWLLWQFAYLCRQSPHIVSRNSPPPSQRIRRRRSQRTWAIEPPMCVNTRGPRALSFFVIVDEAPFRISDEGGESASRRVGEIAGVVTPLYLHSYSYSTRIVLFLSVLDDTENFRNERPGRSFVQVLHVQIHIVIHTVHIGSEPGNKLTHPEHVIRVIPRDPCL
jgi:hypothetical protein